MLILIYILRSPAIEPGAYQCAAITCASPMSCLKPSVLGNVLALRCCLQFQSRTGRSPRPSDLSWWFKNQNRQHPRESTLSRLSISQSWLIEEPRSRVLVRFYFKQKNSMRLLLCGLATMEKSTRGRENSFKYIKLDDSKESSQANDSRVFDWLSENLSDEISATVDRDGIPFLPP